MDLSRAACRFFGFSGIGGGNGFSLGTGKGWTWTVGLIGLWISWLDMFKLGDEVSLLGCGEPVKLKELSAEDFETLLDEPELWRCRPFKFSVCGVETKWSWDLGIGVGLELEELPNEEFKELDESFKWLYLFNEADNDQLLNRSLFVHCKMLTSISLQLESQIVLLWLLGLMSLNLGQASLDNQTIRSNSYNPYFLHLIA